MESASYLITFFTIAPIPIKLIMLVCLSPSLELPSLSHAYCIHPAPHHTLDPRGSWYNLSWGLTRGFAYFTHINVQTHHTNNICSPQIHHLLPTQYSHKTYPSPKTMPQNQPHVMRIQKALQETRVRLDKDEEYCSWQNKSLISITYSWEWLTLQTGVMDIWCLSRISCAIKV